MTTCLPDLKIAIAKPAVLAPKMTDANAVNLLDSLLKNIYRSFDFREEEDVFDRLATSVSGNLLMICSKLTFCVYDKPNVIFALLRINNMID